MDAGDAGDDTAPAFQTALAEHRATASADRTTRTPVEPGKPLRCCPRLRQELTRCRRRGHCPTEFMTIHDERLLLPARRTAARAGRCCSTNMPGWACWSSSRA
ncbi:DUF6207 family protein [Streptomyces gobitricini]|uniref:DUF6207 family protein n=1 Tax=Streptomyces gobitricini TaxID=68211 RepID=UPI0031DBBCE9